MKTIAEYRIRETKGEFFIETIEECIYVTGMLWWKKIHKENKWLSVNFYGEGINYNNIKKVSFSSLGELGSFSTFNGAIEQILDFTTPVKNKYYYQKDFLSIKANA